MFAQPCKSFFELNPDCFQTSSGYNGSQHTNGSILESLSEDESNDMVSMKQVLWHFALTYSFKASGADPTTYEFTTTTPPLYVVG
jgi:hypothetical protein